MINGAHVLIYSKDPAGDRTFFRDVLGFPFVNVGEDWLIFALPPSELAFHPGEGDFVQGHADRNMAAAMVYLMCDDLEKTMQSLKAKKVKCTEVVEAPWGRKTTLRLPSGGEVGLYQPTHQTAIARGGPSR